MPKPHQRTRSRKRHVLKLPSGGGLTTHYRKGQVKASHCPKCGRILFGVPMITPSKLSRLPSSRKRPQRIFGGELCHTCVQESLKRVVRSTNST